MPTASTVLMRPFLLACVLCSVAELAAAQPRLSAAAEGPAEVPAATARQNNGFYLEAFTAPRALFLPTGLAVAPSGRVYVTEKTGKVRTVRPSGEVLDAPLLDLSGEVYPNGDRGLTGIALHPDFPATPYLYLFYPVDDDPAPRPDSRFRGYSRLVRYSIDATGEAVLPDSRLVLLGESAADGPSSCYNSHSAGTIHFGPDGSLFASHGDGASWAEADPGGLYPECFDGTDADPAEDIGSYRAQTTASLAGKILRLDPETGDGLPDNPFWTGDATDDASRVWALGLRNPFRFAVVPPPPGAEGPGELVIGDVGQGSFEELNLSIGGENFGWPCFEGPRIQPEFQEILPPPGDWCETFEGALSTAKAYFHHFLPDASAPAGRVAASITGGAFYSGDAYPDRFRGMLFYADYSVRWIAAGRIGERGLEQGEQVLDDAGNIVDMAYAPALDELLVVDILKGQLARLRNSGGGPLPPVARGRVSAPYGETVHTVTFSDAGSSDPAEGALTYRWSFGYGDAAEGPEVTYGYGTPGTYIATLAVTNEAGLTATETFPITVGESLPELTILEPTAPTVPETGVIALRSQASDRRGDALDLFWEVDLVHNAHTHVGFYRVDGPEGTIRTRPHASPGEVAFYRARAVVTDEEGLRVEQPYTLRDVPAAEVELGGRLSEENVVAFPYPLEVNRVELAPATEQADLQVEVRVDGVWEPVRYLHALREPEATQAVFASIIADAVRVTGADPQLDIGLGVLADPDPDLPERWDPADVGEGSGRTAPFGDGLRIIGEGAIARGAGHMARRPFPLGTQLTARLDAVAGAPEGMAGLTVRSGLDATSSALTVGRTVDGNVRLWRVGEADTTTVTDLFQADEPVWFRASRESDVEIRVEVSRDGVRWTNREVLPTPEGETWLVGPIVGGNERAAIGWFGDVFLREGEVRLERPEVGEFAIQPPFPNPGSGDGTARVEAGLAGTYEALAVDALGRVVQRLEPFQVETPTVVRVDFQRAGLPQGSYVLSVRHLESGETRQVRFAVVR